jgi:hypothetical protein
MPPPNFVARGRFLWNAARCFRSTEEISTFYTRSYGVRALSCPAAHARLRGADFLAAWIPFSIQTNVAADKFRVGMLRIQFVCLVWSFWRLMEFFRYPSL